MGNMETHGMSGNVRKCKELQRKDGNDMEAHGKRWEHMEWMGIYGMSGNGCKGRKCVESFGSAEIGPELLLVPPPD